MRFRNYLIGSVLVVSLAGCALYKQTIKTEKALEDAAHKIAATATNVSARVQGSERRAEETHQVWLKILGCVLLGAGWFTKRTIWNGFRCKVRGKETEKE